jgi:hypothetical protein
LQSPLTRSNFCKFRVSEFFNSHRIYQHLSKPEHPDLSAKGSLRLCFSGPLDAQACRRCCPSAKKYIVLRMMNCRKIPQL